MTMRQFSHEAVHALYVSLDRDHQDRLDADARALGQRWLEVDVEKTLWLRRASEGVLACELARRVTRAWHSILERDHGAEIARLAELPARETAPRRERHEPVGAERGDAWEGRS